MADIWNHDEHTVAIGFTTILGSNSALSQGFITPDNHNVQPTLVLSQSGRKDPGATVYQVQWGSTSTDTSQWLNKQAWGTMIPRGLLPKLIRTDFSGPAQCTQFFHSQSEPENMTEQRVVNEWRRTYSKTVLAPDMMQFGAMSALLAADNNKLKYISYAAVSAKLLARARGVDPEAGIPEPEGSYGMPVTAECVIVIFPIHSWMLQHGWGDFADTPCMRRLASVDNASSMPICIFDSYFYQSQYFWMPTWLGCPLRRDVLQSSTFSVIDAGYTSDYCDKSQAGLGCYDFRINVSSYQPGKLLRHDNIKHMHQAVSDVYATRFGPQNVLVRTTFDSSVSGIASQEFVPWREKQMDAFQGLGHYGTTLMCASGVYANTMLKQPCEVVTQAEAGCFMDCNHSWLDTEMRDACVVSVWYDCGGCTALQVGGASVAAWELITTGSILHPRAEAIPNADRLLQLTEAAQWDSNTIPWCIDFDLGTGKHAPMDAEILSKVPQDMVDALGVSEAYQHSITCSIGGEVDRCSQVMKPGLRPVYLELISNHSTEFRPTQCDIWDKLKIGFAGDSGEANRKSKGPQATHPPLWDLLRVKLHNLSSDAACLPGVSRGGQCFTPFAGHGQLHPSVLNQAVDTVVRDAQTLLKARALSELATMDTTKTWSGALVDMSIIFVAIIAVASGLHGLVEWVNEQCNKLPPTKPLPGRITARCSAEFRRWCDNHTANQFAATGLSCVLVCLGLMTAPIVTAVGEQMARDSNADGKSSDLAWLAVDTGSGKGPYVVLAAVSVTLIAEYDRAAVVLTWINLGMAFVATLCLWYKILKPSDQGTIVPPSFGRRLTSRSTSKSPDGGSGCGIVIKMNHSA